MSDVPELPAEPVDDGESLQHEQIIATAESLVAKLSTWTAMIASLMQQHGCGRLKAVNAIKEARERIAGYRKDGDPEFRRQRVAQIVGAIEHVTREAIEEKDHNTALRGLRELALIEGIYDYGRQSAAAGQPGKVVDAVGADNRMELLEKWLDGLPEDRRIEVLDVLIDVEQVAPGGALAAAGKLAHSAGGNGHTNGKK